MPIGVWLLSRSKIVAKKSPEMASNVKLGFQFLARFFFFLGNDKRPHSLTSALSRELCMAYSIHQPCGSKDTSYHTEMFRFVLARNLRIPTTCGNALTLECRYRGGYGACSYTVKHEAAIGEYPRALKLGRRGSF